MIDRFRHYLFPLPTEIYYFFVKSTHIQDVAAFPRRSEKTPQTWFEEIKSGETLYLFLPFIYLTLLSNLVEIYIQLVVL
jgi:hypothetical protein